MNAFQSTFEYKLIYVFRINDDAHKGLLKIGEATCNTDKTPTDLIPNCHELNVAAKFRINQYTTTAGIAYDLLYTELAQKTVKSGDKVKTLAFRDHDVHEVLKRSGIKNHYFDTERKANEWFNVDLETAKKAISAVKENRSSLLSSEKSEGRNPIIFRPEQVEAIRKTVKKFKTGNQMLWNAKMRFGKTLTALQVAKECRFEHILILTHRPVVSDGWYDDFGKIFYDTDYVFGSKTKGEDISHLIDTDKKFVYFASMQDLRGSESVGGKFDKNDEIFLTKWDFVVIDEAHEGTLTKLGQAVIDTITDLSDNPKILRLSGTPFNLLDKFNEDEIYTWDYVMEQRAKLEWNTAHFGDPNPYATLPELQIFTYNLDKLIPGYMDVEDSAFNFREFFRTWTGNVQKDFKPMPDGALVGDFVHKADVKKFLDIMCASNDKSNYPFSTQEYREFFRHSLWILPGVKEARALSALLKEHSVFGSGAFNIVNVAGNGDEEIDSRDALDAVRKAFGDNPDETYSITLSCGRLTTGVTVSEWTAVFMLAGTFSTSASSYMQTIFRVQSPANINGKVKERCCVFDFAPDRTLKMVAEAGRLSTKTGKTDNDRKIMGEFLNFCPVISVDGSSMQPYNVDRLLQQLKKAYTDRVVRNGFDDRHIYNDNLLKLDDIELADFEALKKIVGASKQTEKVREIDINDQGFTDEEYAELERIEKKPKKERTPEDLALLEEKKKKRDNAQKAMSILRGVSIRIPLLIYGAEVPVDKEITVNNFVDLIDDSSWNEFMPTGVTKATYKKFSKYYEQDVFVAAGRQIRNMALAADELSPDERVKKIAAQFAMFKNPDKETVLTPWRVVNMHMSDCLGGYCFYNEDFTDTLEEPRFVDRGKVTADTLANTKAQILEINSKTGLYPLYVTYSIYRKRCEAVDPKELTIEKQYQLWRQTVEENVFVICKTPMAKAITKRTLLGYRKGKINAHAFDDLIMQLKEKPEQFREKILRGSFWNKENKEMKFDAVVGNPPYQETISNNDSNRSLSKQLFPEFIKLTIKLNPKYSSLITPSRWFTGEAQDGSFISLRKFVKEHNHFVSIYNYSIASNVFNNVWIAGGVNYYLYDRDYSGKVDFYTCNNVKKEKQTRDLFEEGLDIVINSGENYAILQKVRKGDFVSLTTITKGRDAFGITGKNAKNVSEAIFFDGAYELRCAHEEIRYVKKDIITKNMDIANKWKVFISKGNGGAGTLGDEKQVAILGKPYLGKAKSVCTDSLIPIGCFDTEAEALNLQKYIKTKFLRYIVGILKVSQNVYQNVYQFVPLQDFTEKSDIDWSKSVTEIDQQLYKKYNLSDEEITFIESMIKPME
ncbi:MAG TPA: Eco57I restriction-modification methylase domain-containing protein [Candidatus Limadaptatus stercorigallinarum]|uniref:Eco57I restriction-modification methylase domain-containing protein n=1 Tax=Candidatus Limadaptatus stercorigallinarum TaxID=2840845 RepID=A0A9D1L3B9_9FIRM|nr:Eco57I restriction-modification methylase domain-containing protein [Candidatus Limadaptatus stercorigallinarum]